MSVTVRFAPSPTGLLHLGNARTALVNWLFARKHGGTFLLRIDDTDRARAEERYVAAIKEDLAWLGLDWDDEARQSERFSRYDAAAAALQEAGRLYPCYETEDELAIKRRMQHARGQPPAYDRAALELSGDEKKRLEEEEGRSPHWRFKLETDERLVWNDGIRGEQAIDPASLSDPVLIRADGSYLYMLPSTVDDTDFAVTHILRGEDHVANSGVQMQIFRALGAEPPAMAHYPLLGAKAEAKFSKRTGSGSLRALREEAGLEPEAIASFLARIGTADPVEPILDRDALVAGFAIERFSKSGVTFEPGELDRLNAKILHKLDYERVKDRPELAGISREVWEALKPNIAHLRELADWRAVIEGPVTPAIAAEDAEFVREAAEALPEALDGESWRSWTQTLKARTGRSGKALFLPLRKALTGREAGPEMAALLPLIGAETARRRLRGETA